MDSKKLFKSLAYLIFFILVANFLAIKFYWYFSIWYFDIIMHFLGGFWLGLAFVYLFQIKHYSLYSAVKTLFFVLFLGLGWEVLQALVDKIITQDSFDILDTSLDMLFDLFGGLCAILYLWKKSLR